APAAYQQSRPTACSQSHGNGPLRARPDHAVRQPAQDPEAWRAHQAGHAIQISQGVGQPQESSAGSLTAALSQNRT
ncbi:MAG: hypothetical protein ABI197_03175, partial [Granulicella sp.]